MRGHEVASKKSVHYPQGTIEMQAPFFKERGLDLSGFHRGTLVIGCSAEISNSQCSSSFLIGSVDVQTPAEHFSFSACWLTFRNQRYAGLILLPHPETKARHHQNDSVIGAGPMDRRHSVWRSFLDLEVRESEVRS